MSRREIFRTAGSLLMLVVLGGCVGYSGTDFVNGLPIEIDGGEGVVAAAQVRHPRGATPEQISSELARDGGVIAVPGTGEWDVELWYRTGPFCGGVPDVELLPRPPSLKFRIEPVTDDISGCDDLEFDEFVQVRFIAGIDPGDVDAVLIDN